jgi:hypothetical protein
MGGTSQEDSRTSYKLKCQSLLGGMNTTDVGNSGSSRRSVRHPSNNQLGVILITHMCASNPRL